MSIKQKILLLVMLALPTLAGTSYASGFAIIEQSVSGLGKAFAGSAASGENASTIYFNPAAITLLDGQQVTGGIHLIAPSTRFETETATNILGGEITGGNGGNGAKTAGVPNLFYSNKLSDRLSIGLGITAPFGLATEYDKGWVGRYHAVESDVMTLNINPVVAFKVTDRLSLAAGVSAQYMDVVLSSMVDGGLLLASADATYAPLASNPVYDIYAENTADDWGYGYNFGLLYEFTEDTRMGLSYRSKIKHELEGDVDFDVPSAAAMLAASFQDQAISGEITLPAIASLSLYHRVNERWAVMADISWTEWSTFDKLVINFDESGTSSVTTENWDDTWRYSFGATYQASEEVILRGGIAYDETPVADEYRTPRIPDQDRFWLSFGLGYKVSDAISFDAAYTHLFVADSKMEKYATPGTEDQSRGTVIGEFHNSVDIGSIELTYRF